VLQGWKADIPSESHLLLRTVALPFDLSPAQMPQTQTCACAGERRERGMNALLPELTRSQMQSVPDSSIPALAVLLAMHGDEGYGAANRWGRRQGKGIDSLC